MNKNILKRIQSTRETTCNNICNNTFFVYMKADASSLHMIVQK